MSIIQALKEAEAEGVSWVWDKSRLHSEIPSQKQKQTNNNNKNPKQKQNKPQTNKLGIERIYHNTVKVTYTVRHSNMHAHL